MCRRHHSIFQENIEALVFSIHFAWVWIEFPTYLAVLLVYNRKVLAFMDLFMYKFIVTFFVFRFRLQIFIQAYGYVYYVKYCVLCFIRLKGLCKSMEEDWIIMRPTAVLVMVQKRYSFKHQNFNLSHLWDCYFYGPSGMLLIW